MRATGPEGAARRGLYLVQVATGREKQGQFAAAFDAYRAYAAVGDGTLADIEGDPRGQTRPDLWARGRLERMAAANADAAGVVTRCGVPVWCGPLTSTTSRTLFSPRWRGKVIAPPGRPR